MKTSQKVMSHAAAEMKLFILLASNMLFMSLYGSIPTTSISFKTQNTKEKRKKKMKRKDKKRQEKRRCCKERDFFNALSRRETNFLEKKVKTNFAFRSDVCFLSRLNRKFINNSHILTFLN